MAIEGGLKAAIATLWDAAARISPGRPWLTVLYYHAVRAEQASAFDAQMAYLQRTANLVRPDHRGALDPSRPNVAVTFDDAFRSVRDNALPALVRRQVPATIFVPTGWAGRQPDWKRQADWDDGEVVMSLEELAELPADLIALGSHSVDHVHLSRLPDAQVEAQLRGSREALEAVSGRPVDMLSLPYGDYDPRVLELARAARYRCVFLDRPFVIREGDPALVRGRTAVGPGDALPLFGLKSRGAFAWLPAAVRVKAVLSGELRALRPSWRWQERF